MSGEQQYLMDLVRAWAGGRTTPLPLPAGVAVQAVRERLLAHNIEAVLGPLLPEPSRDTVFSKQMSLSRSRSDFLLLEYERLLPVLSASAWRPVLLKGAALALRTYEQPTDRWFLDLDVLVPRAEVNGVCARLEAAGYRHLRGKRDPLFYEKYHLHRIMLGPQGSVVEVHWALTIPGSVYGYDVAGVFDRAEICRLGRHEARCAAPVDQVLHAVYQNIADGFIDLRRVLDMTLLMRRLEAVDWRYLVSEAQRTGMARGLYLTLHQVKLIAGVEPPTGTMAALDPGPATRRTLRGLQVVAGCLDRKASSTEGYAQTLHLLLTPGARLRAREIFRSIWVGEALLLDQGHRPDQMPGIAHKTLIGLRQFKTLVFLSWRTARALATG